MDPCPKQRMIIVTFYDDFTRRPRRNETAQPRRLGSGASILTCSCSGKPIGLAHVPGHNGEKPPVPIDSFDPLRNIERRFSGVS
jgi:hypothetical protein